MKTTQTNLDTRCPDSRRMQREARARPWLTNSVLRRRSAVGSATGANRNEDAPELPLTANVTTATANVTEKKVPASRIPVRIGTTGCRPASQRVRPGQPPFAHAVSPTDNHAGQHCGTGGSVALPTTKWPSALVARNQYGFSLEPIKSHRIDYIVKPILKHPAGPTGESTPVVPTDSTDQGQGLTIRGCEKKKKKVRVFAEPTFHTSARQWNHVRTWRHLCCGQELCLCNRPRRYEGQQWLEDQLRLGHDYLELSGGVFGAEFVSWTDPTSSEQPTDHPE